MMVAGGPDSDLAAAGHDKRGIPFSPASTLPSPLLHRLCYCNQPQHHRNERARERERLVCLHSPPVKFVFASDYLCQCRSTTAPPAGSLPQLKRVSKLGLQHEDALCSTCMAGVHPVLQRGSSWSHQDGKAWRTGRERGGEHGPPRPRQPGSTRTADQLDTPANPTNLTPNVEEDEGSNQPPPEGDIPFTRLRASPSAADAASEHTQRRRLEIPSPAARRFSRLGCPTTTANRSQHSQQAWQQQQRPQRRQRRIAAAGETTKPPRRQTPQQPAHARPNPHGKACHKQPHPPNLPGRASRQPAAATTGGATAEAEAAAEAQTQQPHPANAGGSGRRDVSERGPCPPARQTHRHRHRQPSHRRNSSRPKPKHHQCKCSTQQQQQATAPQQQQETKAKQAGLVRTESTSQTL